MWSMISDVFNDAGKVRKIQNSMVKSILKDISRPGYLTIDFNGKELDVLGPMVYLVSSAIGPACYDNIAKLVSDEDIIKALPGGKIRSPKIKGYDSWVGTDEVAKVYLGCNINFRFIGSLLRDLADNSDAIKAEVVSEAIVIALNTLYDSDKIPCNVFSATSCVVLFWTLKNIKVVPNALYNFKSISALKRFNKDEYKEGLDSILNAVFEPKSVDMMKKFIERTMIVGDYDYDVVSESLEDMTDLVIKSSRKNEYVTTKFEEIKAVVFSDKSLFTYFTTMLDRRYMSRYLGALFCTSTIISGCFKPNIAILGLMVSNGLSLDKPRKYAACSKEYIGSLLGHMAIAEAVGANEFTGTMCSWVMAASYPKHKFNKERLKDCESREANLEDRNKSMRKELRALKKQTDALIEQERQLRKKQSQLEELAASKIQQKDLDERDAKLNRAKDDADRLADELNEVKRCQTKQTRELEESQQLVASLQDKLKTYENKLKLERAKGEKLAVHRAFKEIPVECFVNAIKDYKIVLIGGDMMFNKLAHYGLDKIRTYKAGYRHITYESISDVDYVVISTAFIDHSTIEGVVNDCKKHNIPIIMFNNKNADMLVYSIFSTIHS